MKVLAIDTSSRCGVIGLWADGVPLAELSLQSNENHSARLLPGVDWLLKSLQLAPADMDGFGVVVGPGSFTGLRVGLATIKGFAWSLGKPVAGLSSLEVLAHGVSERSGQIVPMLDARKGRVYSALYQALSGEELSAVTPAVDVDAVDFIRSIPGNLLLLGDGARKYEAGIRAAAGERVRFAPAVFDLPRGMVAAELAAKALSRGETLDVEKAEPAYLRLSEAEVKARIAQ